MKTTILVIISLLIFVSCQHSSVDIPEPIVKSVEELYPNAREINWLMEDGEYEATFEVDGNEVKLLFDEKGKILESKNELDEEELPEAIKLVLETRFNNLEVDDVVRIEKDGKISYELELDLCFAEDGSLLSEKEPEENGDQIQK